MATASDGSPPPVVPRTIDAYYLTDHACDRFECPRRPINRDRAARAIEAGVVETNPIPRDGRAWRYRHRVDGCDVVVGAADADEHFRDFVVLTAYVDVADAAKAWSSPAWSTADVSTAALLQYLGGDRSIEAAGYHPTSIHVTDPVDYHGHRLIHTQASTRSRCVDCGFRAADQYRFERHGCR